MGKYPSYSPKGGVKVTQVAEHRLVRVVGIDSRRPEFFIREHLLPEEHSLVYLRQKSDLREKYPSITDPLIAQLCESLLPEQQGQGSIEQLTIFRAEVTKRTKFKIDVMPDRVSARGCIDAAFRSCGLVACS
jgi:hypothetical protein